MSFHREVDRPPGPVPAWGTARPQEGYCSTDKSAPKATGRLGPRPGPNHRPRKCRGRVRGWGGGAGARGGLRDYTRVSGPSDLDARTGGLYCRDVGPGRDTEKDSFPFQPMQRVAWAGPGPDTPLRKQGQRGKTRTSCPLPVSGLSAGGLPRGGIPPLAQLPVLPASPGLSPDTQTNQPPKHAVRGRGWRPELLSHSRVCRAGR